MTNSIQILILTAIAALLIVLQTRLAHARRWWPGLILPMIHLLLTAAILIGSLAGISFPAAAIGGADGPTSIFIRTDQVPLRAMIAINIPTVVYITILLVLRRRDGHRRNINKTRIRDL